MKLLSLVLVASLAASGYAHAQTAEQSPAKPPASSSPASDAGSPGHACKKEIKKLCGRTHNQQEMESCIKDNLDMKKFSADCQTKLSSGKKPGS